VIMSSQYVSTCTGVIPNKDLMIRVRKGSKIITFECTISLIVVINVSKEVLVELSSISFVLPEVVK